MNWKPLLFVVIVVVFIGTLAQGALFGDDEIDRQVHDIEESIVETSGNEKWSFSRPECPRFDELNDGERIFCNATAKGSDGSEAPARFIVTLRNCKRSNSDLGGTRCDHRFDWSVQ